MKALQQLFLISKSEFLSIKELFDLPHFIFELKCQDIGEGIVLEFNDENLEIQTKKLEEKLCSLNGLIEEEDYISIAILSKDKVIYIHENKRMNYKINSWIEMFQNPTDYPNYKEVDTIPWWEND